MHGKPKHIQIKQDVLNLWAAWYSDILLLLYYISPSCCHLWFSWALKH